jgi:hypothetical protein
VFPQSRDIIPINVTYPRNRQPRYIERLMESANLDTFAMKVIPETLTLLIVE